MENRRNLEIVLRQVERGEVGEVADGGGEALQLVLLQVQHLEGKHIVNMYQDYRSLKFSCSEDRHISNTLNLQNKHTFATKAKKVKLNLQLLNSFCVKLGEEKPALFFVKMSDKLWNGTADRILQNKMKWHIGISFGGVEAGSCDPARSQGQGGDMRNACMDPTAIYHGIASSLLLGGIPRRCQEDVCLPGCNPVG